MFTSKYFVHLIIVVIGVLIVVSNINAKETRSDDYGEKTIMFALAHNVSSPDTIIEEKANAQTKKTVVNYLEQTGQVKSGTVKDQGDSQVIDAKNLATTTQGGTALIKPTITKPIEDNQIDDNSDEQVYTVQSGDTMSTIADKFGISTATILWENDLYDNHVLKPGEKLKILPVTGLTHKVASGDTLNGIAEKYKADPNKILEYNRIIAASDILVGQTLIIPDGQKAIKKYIPPAPTYVSNSPNVAPVSNILAPPDKKVVQGGKMAWPTSWHVITQYYSWRHTGLDIDGDYNSPIYAADNGVIIRQGWGNGYGNMIIVDHGNGVQTLYAHLSKFFLKQGDRVSKGQTMGMMGSTGWSTGTHIHFEVRINGVKMNPLSYIR